MGVGWPWVSRKRLEKAEGECVRLGVETADARRQASAAKVDRDEWKKRAKVLEDFAAQFHGRRYRAMEFGRYAVQVTFDPRLCMSHDGYGTREAMENIADMVAYQIRAEIASGRYIKTAEMERWEKENYWKVTP